MIDAFTKLTESMRGKIQLMIGRAILSVVNDAGPVQTVQAQMLADEVQDDVERIQQYGFSSAPLPGAEGVVVFVGGNRDHGLLIACDDRRYRKRGLQPGEVALYTDEGDQIVLSRGRVIKVTAGAALQVNAPVVTLTASSKVRLETPILEVTGNIKDNCDAGGKTMLQMRQAYNTHTHTENNVAGGQTSTTAQQV
ncbi:MAG: phage baseplate assembly protein V [Limnobacter sp.]|uniref:phage baseplate assembly protein V n=1 Tax=Limnobacter sp. TaxID=2003368 RepID=UPI00391BDBFA